MSFRLSKPLTAALMAAALCATSTFAHVDKVTVNLDQAKIVKMPDRIATIVIGNPAIADAALQPGGILVVTGKGYGATNMVALDRQGRVVMDNQVVVVGPPDEHTLIVQRGLDTETYSCMPRCMPRLTLGDTPAYFNAVGSEMSSRNGFSSGTAK